MVSYPKGEGGIWWGWGVSPAGESRLTYEGQIYTSSLGMTGGDRKREQIVNIQRGWF